MVVTCTADNKMRQVRAALKHAIARLEQCNAPSASLAAELLLMHVLRRDRTWLYAHPEYQLSLQDTNAYAEAVESRAAGTPTQYLTGTQEFWGLEFEVGPGVLIPRPETEHVIEVALQLLKDRLNEPLGIADIGTGSGCIAIALARELPKASVVATDISATALEYARRNAERHGVSNRILFYRADLLRMSGLHEANEHRRFDMVISNPPYVGWKDRAGLPREVRDHEPAEALFAGEEGLDIYPRLINEAAGILSPSGALVLELGYNGADFVRSLLSAAPWADVRTTRDLAGIERVISAVLSA